MAEGFWHSQSNLLMSNEAVEQPWQGFKYSFSSEALKVMSDVEQRTLLLMVDANRCLNAFNLELIQYFLLLLLMFCFVFSTLFLA